MKAKDNKERNEQILELACEFLEKMNVGLSDAYVEDLDSSESEEGDNVEQVLVSVKVERPGSLIGFKGRNLSSFQTLLGLMIKEKLGSWIRVLVDVNDYREEQKNRLTEMSINLAKKVMETGKEASMVPMSSYERRICHMVLAEMDEVITESEGEGDFRHVVVKKVGNANLRSVQKKKKTEKKTAKKKILK